MAKCRIRIILDEHERADSAAEDWAPLYHPGSVIRGRLVVTASEASNHEAFGVNLQCMANRREVSVLRQMLYAGPLEAKSYAYPFEFECPDDPLSYDGHNVVSWRLFAFQEGRLSVPASTAETPIWVTLPPKVERQVSVAEAVFDKSMLRDEIAWLAIVGGIILLLDAGFFGLLFSPWAEILEPLGAELIGGAAAALLLGTFAAALNGVREIRALAPALSIRRIAGRVEPRPGGLVRVEADVLARREMTEVVAELVYEDSGLNLSGDRKSGERTFGEKTIGCPSARHIRGDVDFALPDMSPQNLWTFGTKYVSGAWLVRLSIAVGRHRRYVHTVPFEVKPRFSTENTSPTSAPPGRAPESGAES